MPRRTPAFRAVHKDADKIEKRMARAQLLAWQRLQSRIPLRKIAEAIAAKDQRTVAHLIDEIDVEDALEPVSKILRDAFIKGGKLSKKEATK